MANVRVEAKKRGLKYVYAKRNNSCVVACLAMVTGQTFERTLKGLGPYWEDKGQFEGIGDDVFEEYLAARGWAVQNIRHEYAPEIRLRTKWPPKPWAQLHVADVFDQGMHAVVMCADGYVLDPNDTKKHSLADYHRVFGVTGLWKIGDSMPVL